jgi:DHA2 family multidrug resistance protein-like MFS transporter
MSVIFETMPLESAPSVALVLAGLCATVSALVSLGRVKFETAA